MATHVADGAAVFLHLPLRLGFILEKLEGKYAVLPRLSRTLIGKVPIRRNRGTPCAPDVRVEPGVAPALGEIFGAATGHEPRPLYDRDHFFFRAEDGIRDGRVTGVQTCALPI